MHRAVLVHHQRQLRAKIHHDLLNLPTFAFGVAVIAALEAVKLVVGLAFTVFLTLKQRHDTLQVVPVAVRHHHHGVGADHH